MRVDFLGHFGVGDSTDNELVRHLLLRRIRLVCAVHVPILIDGMVTVQTGLIVNCSDVEGVSFQGALVHESAGVAVQQNVASNSS